VRRISQWLWRWPLSPGGLTVTAVGATLVFVLDVHGLLRDAGMAFLVFYPVLIGSRLVDRALAQTMARIGIRQRRSGALPLDPPQDASVINESSPAMTGNDR
jgi:hypothetical protein